MASLSLSSASLAESGRDAEEDHPLLQLSAALDSHAMGLRQALLELFAATRLRLQQAAEAEVRGERERCARTTQALTERCLTLQAELAGRDQQVATLRGHVTELLRVAEERTLGLRAYCLAQRAFHRWRRFARAARHRRQLEAAVAWQRRRALAQRTFDAWRRVALESHHRAAAAHAALQQQQAAARLQAEAAAEVAAARRQAAALQDALAAERESRALLEERLKTAFMKGVCALNLEAMSVLRPERASPLGRSASPSVAQLLAFPPAVSPPSDPGNFSGLTASCPTAPSSIAQPETAPAVSPPPTDYAAAPGKLSPLSAASTSPSSGRHSPPALSPSVAVAAGLAGAPGPPRKVSPATGSPAPEPPGRLRGGTAVVVERNPNMPPPAAWADRPEGGDGPLKAVPTTRRGPGMAVRQLPAPGRKLPAAMT